MRIVAGSARGTALATPKSGRTRPTSDKVRQALFNTLEHGVAGFDIEGMRVLDLFAGTGALGLEALSRGAGFCVFIDEDAGARGLIRDNVMRTHMTGKSRISRRDATRLGAVGKYEPFDLAFADPPYGKGLGTAAMRSALEGGWLKAGAVAVVEEAKGAEFAWPEGIEALDERSYRDTVVRIGRADR
jgi:16S rRNA (guanine966-N2)-methyltransferase